MKDLLAQLKELDRLTYDTVMLHLRELSDVDSRWPDVIQGCIQRTIEARRWHWELKTSENYQIRACVGSIHDPATEWIYGYITYRTTPADALLSAYLEALRNDA